MKKYIVSVCLAVATLLTGKLEAYAQTSTPIFNSYQWHTLMNQSSRNSWIIAVANSQIGQKKGSCKVWVQDLIYSICGVWVPQNANISAPWYWQMPWFGSSVGYVTGYYSYQCPLIVPGCIIQMQVPSRTTGVLIPHTAIVDSIKSDRYVFIDCNWFMDSTTKLPDEKVSRHEVTFSDFKRWTQSYYYSVYTIQ